MVCSIILLFFHEPIGISCVVITRSLSIPPMHLLGITIPSFVHLTSHFLSLRQNTFPCHTVILNILTMSHSIAHPQHRPWASYSLVYQIPWSLPSSNVVYHQYFASRISVGQKQSFFYGVIIYLRLTNLSIIQLTLALAPGPGMAYI